MSVNTGNLVREDWTVNGYSIYRQHKNRGVLICRKGAYPHRRTASITFTINNDPEELNTQVVGLRKELRDYWNTSRPILVSQLCKHLMKIAPTLGINIAKSFEKTIELLENPDIGCKNQNPVKFAQIERASTQLERKDWIIKNCQVQCNTYKRRRRGRLICQQEGSTKEAVVNFAISDKDDQDLLAKVLLLREALYPLVKKKKLSYQQVLKIAATKMEQLGIQTTQYFKDLIEMADNVQQEGTLTVHNLASEAKEDAPKMIY